MSAGSDMIAMLLAVVAAAGSAFVVRRETGGGLVRLLGVHLAAAAFATLALRMAGGAMSDALYLGALTALCLAIAWIDSCKFIIPDTLMVGLVGVALLAPFCPPFQAQAVGAVVMGAVFVAVRQAHFALRGMDGLGLGDVKLAIVLGAVLGVHLALLATGIAAAFTALYVVMRPFITKYENDEAMQTGAPFGVGLSAALVSACAAMVAPA